MGCQKVCKQGRDDIIVKVNLQSLIPTSFYIAVTNQCQNDAGMWLCKFTFTIISSLPCLHTFWHPIPTSFYIFNVFKSCVYMHKFEGFILFCGSYIEFPHVTYISCSQLQHAAKARSHAASSGRGPTLLGHRTSRYDETPVSIV